MPRNSDGTLLNLDETIFATYGNGWCVRSDKIHVYPCAYRGNNNNKYIDVEAKLQTEYNFTHNNTGVINRNTYLFSEDWDEAGANPTVKFSIYGYYFELQGVHAADCPKYAAIKLLEAPISSGSETKSWVLTDAREGEAQIIPGFLDVEKDTSSYFAGLFFTDTVPDPAAGYHYIQLVTDEGKANTKAFCPAVYTGEEGGLALNDSGNIASGYRSIAAGYATDTNNAENSVALGEGTKTALLVFHK